MKAFAAHRCIAIAATFALLLLSGCGAPSTPAPSTGNAAADQTLKAGAKALPDLMKSADAHPGDYQSQVAVAVVAYVNKDYKTAVKYYERAVKADPKSGLAYNNLANAYLNGLHDQKSALANYQKATAVDPSYGNAWLNLATLQEQLGNKKQAKAVLQQAVKVVPSSDPASGALQSLLKKLS